MAVALGVGMADRKPKGQIAVEKVMNRLNESLKKYSEIADTVMNQKPFATLDYDYLIKELTAAIKDAKLVAAVLEKGSITINDFEPFVKSLLKVEEALLLIIEGLGRKAHATGSYGWFAYRKDKKNHDKLKQEFQYYARKFGDNIEAVPIEDNTVTATAHILAVGADEVVVQKMEIPKEDYNKFKDESDIIYVMQGFEAGVPQYTILEKEMWKSLEVSWVVTPEQRQARTDKMMADILGTNHEK
jgi:hypothetical protein